MTSSERYLAILTTVADQQTARMIAHALVEQRLAACVQIHKIDSVYRWNGKVHEDEEWRVLAKTTQAAADRAREAIRALHPYDVPAIVALELRDVDAPYAAWIDASVG
jgi:periplasmic divalent cation tolerance protein